MNRDSNIKERISDYIYNDMSAEEIIEMEEQISRDPELAESLKLNLKVKEYLKARIELEEMRSDPLLEEAEKLADMALSEETGNENTGAKKKNSARGFIRSKIGYVSLAAAVILSLIVIRLFIPLTDSDRLYQKYYEPLQASSFIQRNTGPVPFPGFVEGVSYYKEGNYSASTEMLSGLGTPPGTYPEIRLFLGLSYMGLEQHETAAGILEEFIENSSRYIPEARWYLSLCYMKMEDTDKAEEMLSRLESIDGMYKKDSQTLLRKLRRVTR